MAMVQADEGNKDHAHLRELGLKANWGGDNANISELITLYLWVL